MLFRSNDGVPVAGPAYREYVEDYFRGNSIVHGNASLAGRPARIDAVTAAILNVVAEKDHIVPKDSSLALERLVRPAADYEAKLFPVGHIGLSVGSGAYSKVWAPVRDWLAQRSGEV